MSNSLEAIVGRHSGCSPKEIPFTPLFKEVVYLASSKAEQLGYTEIDTIHIFLALISQNESVAVKLLEQLGFDVHQLGSQIIEWLGYQEAELTTKLLRS
ncbi:Clp protease N-terminal domain-containing protein [Microcoleus sp. herbarium8]|uniref:Clp protease N-terminal domain-containing protein n=1 Tax=Microcoleus sp. herbarium8 TaxID=3055436 RepID=UPI002FD18E95